MYPRLYPRCAGAEVPTIVDAITSYSCIVNMNAHDYVDILQWGDGMLREVTPSMLNAISGSERWRKRLLLALHGEDRGEQLKKELFAFLDTLSDDDRLLYIMEIGKMRTTVAVVSEYVIASSRNDPNTIGSHIRILVYCHSRDPVLEEVCLPTFILLRDMFTPQQLGGIADSMNGRVIYRYLFEDATAKEVVKSMKDPIRIVMYLYCVGCVSENKLVDLVKRLEKRRRCEHMFHLVCLPVVSYKTGWMLLTEQVAIKACGVPLESYDRNMLQRDAKERLTFLINANAEV